MPYGRKRMNGNRRGKPYRDSEPKVLDGGAVITYRTYDENRFTWAIGVLLDYRLVGYIERLEVANGYGYFYRAKSGGVGETFATVEEVKASIEGTDDAGDT